MVGIILCVWMFIYCLFWIIRLVKVWFVVILISFVCDWIQGFSMVCFLWVVIKLWYGGGKGKVFYMEWYGEVSVV